jgi:hypothetical protein
VQPKSPGARGGLGRRSGLVQTAPTRLPGLLKKVCFARTRHPGAEATPAARGGGHHRPDCER